MSDSSIRESYNSASEKQSREYYNGRKSYRNRGYNDSDSSRSVCKVKKRVREGIISNRKGIQESGFHRKKEYFSSDEEIRRSKKHKKPSKREYDDSSSLSSMEHQIEVKSKKKHKKPSNRKYDGSSSLSSMEHQIEVKSKKKHKKPSKRKYDDSSSLSSIEHQIEVKSKKKHKNSSKRKHDDSSSASSMEHQIEIGPSAGAPIEDSTTTSVNLNRGDRHPAIEDKTTTRSPRIAISSANEIKESNSKTGEAAICRHANCIRAKKHKPFPVLAGSKYCQIHTCTIEGCFNKMEGSAEKNPVCRGHGAGRKCPNCGKGAAPQSLFCLTHGQLYDIRPKCEWEGCDKLRSIKFKTVYCSMHGKEQGTIPTCASKGCNNLRRGALHCSKHRGCVCKVELCGKLPQGGTPFCIAHGGGYRCIVPKCTTSANGRKLCYKHRNYEMNQPATSTTNQLSDLEPSSTVCV